jgi:hypothetical protein
LSQFVFALVDLLGVAFFHRLLEVGLTRADFVLGVEHLVFPFLLQGSVGAMGSDFVQGGFQARLLIGVAAGLGQFDLVFLRRSRSGPGHLRRPSMERPSRCTGSTRQAVKEVS